MELILTSFGISHLPQQPRERIDLFYRMPPIWMNRSFMLDYAILLLCERIIIDSETFERFLSGKYAKLYGEVANMVKALYDEGFVRVENFDNIVRDNRKLLDLMLERDLKRLDDWVNTLKESVDIWDKFLDSVSVGDSHRCLSWLGWPGLHGVSSYSHRYQRLQQIIKQGNSTYQGDIKPILTEYLSYVNANLVLSFKFNVGFHDWQDFLPFYRDKFLTIGCEDIPEQKYIKKIKQLFEVFIPEVLPREPKDIIRVLKDKRISDLRNMVDKAVKEGIEFDYKFANSITQEVLKIEKRIGRIRKFISYVTVPIGFIPWIGTILEKGSEEIVSHALEEKTRKNYQWFYLLTELN